MGKPIPKGSLLHALRVSLDHLLIHVTRTTNEFFKVSVGAFTGENLNIQAQTRLAFRCYEDFVDIFVNKLRSDGTGCCSLLQCSHGCFQCIDLLAEFLLGVKLLLQFDDLCFCVGDLGGSLLVHGNEVCIRNCAGYIVFQQLGFFL